MDRADRGGVGRVLKVGGAQQEPPGIYQLASQAEQHGPVHTCFVKKRLPGTLCSAATAACSWRASSVCFLIGNSSTTDLTGLGTISNAQSSVLRTSTKLVEAVGHPSFSRYTFITSGLDSRGSQTLDLDFSAAIV